MAGRKRRSRQSVLSTMPPSESEAVVVKAIDVDPAPVELPLVTAQPGERADVKSSPSQAAPDTIPQGIPADLWEKIKVTRPDTKEIRMGRWRNVRRPSDGPHLNIESIGGIKCSGWHPNQVRSLPESMFKDAVEAGLEWVCWSQHR